MKNLLSFTIVAFFLFSCQNKEKLKIEDNYGGIDFVFAAHYQNCLSIISLHHLGKEDITNEQVLNALICLEAITNIEHNVYLGDMIGYREEEDYEKDIKKWSHWYAENKYGYTFNDANQAFERFRMKTEMQPEWPLFLTDILAK